MALDGIVVASLAKELQENFTNARLSKIKSGGGSS